MLKRLFSHCMLRPADLAPVHDGTRVVGVFNPGAIAVGDEVVLLVRVVEQPMLTQAGFLPSPRIDAERGLVVDWLDENDVDQSDPRVYQLKSDGSLRLRFISHLKVVRSRDGKTFTDLDGPTIMPEGPYEIYGIEDPRITTINGTHYITYVAVSDRGVSTCLMSTTDFVHFKRHGVIFCPDNKDVVIFPEKIFGAYVAMHRPMPSMPFSPPQIWLARSPDLIHWGTHEQILGGDDSAHKDRIGGGTPPIKTDQGWLTIYHGSDKSHGETGAGVYTAGTLLLDLQNPRKIIARSQAPIMAPQEPFETTGFVDNVVFPTAIVERDDCDLVYYGAADENVGVVGYAKGALAGASAS